MPKHQRSPITFHLLATAAIALGGCTGSEADIPVEEPAIETGAAPGALAESEGPALSEISAEPMSPQLLLQAAEQGDVEKLRQVLGSGTAVSHTDEDGRTPLMLSAFDGHTEAVDLLLEAGAKIDTRDANGRTALMYASTGPNADTVQSLLAAGAQVNLVDAGEHWTALMFAAAEGQDTVVRLLLEKGADKSLRDIDGDTAAAFALQRGHRKLAGTLAE